MPPEHAAREAPKPSPYVSVYLARNQMRAIREALSGGKPRKRDLDAAIRHIEEALGE